MKRVRSSVLAIAVSLCLLTVIYLITVNDKSDIAGKVDKNIETIIKETEADNLKVKELDSKQNTAYTTEVDESKILTAPEYEDVNEYIQKYLDSFQEETLDGSATEYDFNLHLLISSADYAKHFASLSNDAKEIKKLNKIAEIGDLRFSEADFKTVEERKQMMIEELNNFN